MALTMADFLKKQNPQSVAPEKQTMAKYWPTKSIAPVSGMQQPDKIPLLGQSNAKVGQTVVPAKNEAPQASGTLQTMGGYMASWAKPQTVQAAEVAPAQKTAADSTLTEENRQRLDGIVQKMIADKQSDTNIRLVVEDFKQKYGAKGEVASVVAAAPENKKSITGFIGNAFSSAGKVIGDIANAVTHPVETIKGIGDVIEGAGEKIGRKVVAPVFKLDASKVPVSEKEQKINNLVDYFGQRYGGNNANEVAKNIGDTAYSDPAGFLLDLSTFIGGGAGAAGKVGKLKGVANVMSKADPLPIVAKAAGKAVSVPFKAAGNLGAEILGTTTGAGSRSIKEAFKATPEFTEAMRGKISPEQIVQTTRGGIGKVKQARGAEYQKAMGEIEKTNQQIYDIAPVKSKFNETLEQFGGVLDDEGTIDLTASALIDDTNKITAIKKLLDRWETTPGKLTVKGVDTLKQQLNNFKVKNNDALNKFIDNVSRSAKEMIKEVPGYKQMEKAYGTQSEFIKQLESAFDSKNSVDTAINKLNATMKQNKGFKQNLLDQLNAEAGQNINAQVSGSMMNPKLPQGFAKAATQIGTAGAVAMGVGMVKLLPWLAVASPRLVGEFLRLSGAGANQIKKINQAVAAYKKAAETAAKAGYYQQKTESKSNSEE